MTPDDELTLRLALTRLRRLQPAHQRQLYSVLGSALDIYNSIPLLDTLLPSATHALRDELAMIDGHVQWAEDEIHYCNDSGIDILCFDNPRFPALLNSCDDAPTVLYSIGRADYCSPHIIASVGTRHCSEYGRDVCRSVCTGLSASLPDAVVVSGLAYGIDIASHRAALDCGLSTVAVVAHGLNEIYPSIHRIEAKAMVNSGGGIITEYPSHTRIEKRNFVSRNRIVAGMSHATIVVESAAKGGSLITADMAFGYNRELFACPGRVTDELSVGCNQLIASQKAHVFTGIEGLLQEMGWGKSPEAIQGELFPNILLGPEEQQVYDILMRLEQVDAYTISESLGKSLRATLSLLNRMELDGHIRLVAGDFYRLCR